MLTGAPCDKYHLVTSVEESRSLFATGEGCIHDKNEIWLQLLSCFESKFLLATSCSVREGDTEARYQDLGLQCRHAYTILQLKTVQIGGGGGGGGSSGDVLRLVELRNPWGRGSWKGDFSMKSDRWTSSMREKVGYYCGVGGGADEDDGGVFWMNLDDWFYHFTTLYVCRAREQGEGWTEVRARAPKRSVVVGQATVRPTLPCFRLEIFETTNVEMTLHQASDRGDRSGGSGGGAQHGNHFLASIGMVVMRENPTSSFAGGKSAVCQNLNYVASSSVQCHPRVRCDSLLEPGSYVVVPLVFTTGDDGSRSTGLSSLETPRGRTERDALLDSIVLSVVRNFSLFWTILFIPLTDI